MALEVVLVNKEKTLGDRDRSLFFFMMPFGAARSDDGFPFFGSPVQGESMLLNTCNCCIILI